MTQARNFLNTNGWCALTWHQWKYLDPMIIFQTSALNVIVHEECLYAGYSNVTKQELRVIGIIDKILSVKVPVEPWV